MRGVMTIYELICSKVRSVNGGLFISQASGKIKSVESDATNYYLTLEESSTTFMAHDFLRMQTYTGRSIRGYHVEIDSVDESGRIAIAKEKFYMTEGSSLPMEGDDVVQCGNSTDPNRQTVIYLHADGSTPPAIDIMLGVNSVDWTDKVAVSLGVHNGVLGLYCKNGKIYSTGDNGVLAYELNPDGSGQLGQRCDSLDGERRPTH